jgi:solute carrier family 25 (adenine nucleotide translocator) protein 4/5/6/31
VLTLLKIKLISIMSQ